MALWSTELPHDGGGPAPHTPHELRFYDAPPPYGGGRVTRQLDIDPVLPGRVSSSYRHVSLSDAEYEKSVVKSAHRALQVFEFLAEYRQPASATEIAANLGLPQSSASMLLRSLVSLGYLDYCRDTRRFSPTLRLSLIGAWRPDRIDIATDIVRQMQHLNEATGECVLLAEQYRHYVRYIYVFQSRDPAKVYYVPLGNLRPICTTACGQMLLSDRPQKEVRTIIHRARSDHESVDYGVSIEGVVEAVDRARADGYAHTSRVVDDFRSYQLAALLPQRAGEPRLAIGISSYGERFVARKEALLTQLLEAVSRLSSAPPESHP